VLVIVLGVTAPGILVDVASEDTGTHSVLVGPVIGGTAGLHVLIGGAVLLELITAPEILEGSVITFRGGTADVLPVGGLGTTFL